MTSINRLLGLLLFSSLCGSFPMGAQSQTCEQLIWHDEFNGTALDTSLWSYEIGDGCPNLCGWGNNEQQYYSDLSQNIRLNNGRLVITAREDSLGGLSYSSAKINSLRKGDFKYGRFEARMKFPLTQGMWPAFWMLPTEKVYGTWPKSGEIDIVEMIGSKPDEAVGTMHTGLPHTYISGYYNLPPGETFADTFHVFSITWEPDSITWFVDGVKYHQLTPNDIGPWVPFQEEFYLILNLAVGGNWPGPVDSTTILPQTFEVDYVRVYNRPERLPIRGEQPMVEALGLEYSTFEIAGANYIWSVPSDATITSGQGTHQITVDWGCTVGSVDLDLQTNCDTASLSYTVPGFLIPGISGPATVIENQSSITYSLPQASSGVFTWQVPAGATIVSGQGSHEIVVDWGCNSGAVTVSLNNSCGTSFNDTLSVSLQTYAISGQPSVPPNTTNRIYSVAQIPGASYSWSVPVDATIVSGQGTNEITVDFGISDGLISVLIVTPCATSNYDLPLAIGRSFLYADFDSINLKFIAYDGAVFQKVANPSPSGINVSDSVGRVNKTVGAETYSGIEADVYEIALDLRPVMSQKVYSSSTGVVRFMLDDETTGQDRLKIDMNYGPTNVNKWVKLVYDFTGAPSEIYDQLRLTYNHGSTGTEYWYFDDVMGQTDLNLGFGSEKGEEISELIAVYPSPSSGVFYLDTREVIAIGSNYKLEILDASGRSILDRQVISDEQPVILDLNDQPAGLYLLHVSGNSLHYIKAITKIE